MTHSLSIHDAARKIHKEDWETYEMLKDGRLQGRIPGDGSGVKMPEVDCDSIDEYLANQRKPKAAPTAVPVQSVIDAGQGSNVRDWQPEEDRVLLKYDTGESALAAYRDAFPRSKRTDKAITNRWSQVRVAAGYRKRQPAQHRKKPAVPAWRTWFHRIMGWLPWRKSTVGV